ncbi:Lsr2 family protein [Microbacterium oleivorans]|uniref:histone-like nucleoid-structuring protein Lsr2 n=1 Tax=Microbacterium oleivorans TaxID=273677 RepID=UPI0033FB9D7A
MARKVIESITDDIDGSEGAETVTFSYKGTNYEIDLNDKNAQKLEAALEPYVSAGRKVGRASSSTASRGPKKDLDAIRTWARENGHEVSDRGRIAASVVEAYEAANK